MSQTPPDGPGWSSPSPTPPAGPPGWQPAPPAPVPPTGWGAQPAPPAGGAPTGWGQPAAPGWTGPGSDPSGQPPTGQWGPPPGTDQWVPPVLQPGIVPLRPLSLGELLDGGIKAIRFNPAVMFGLTAVVVAVCTLIGTVVGNYLGGLALSDTSLDPAASGLTTSFGSLTSAFSQGGSSVLVSLVSPLITGLLIVAVSQAVLGRRIRISEVLRSRRVWWVLLFTVLTSLAETVALAAVVVPVVLLAERHTGWAVLIGLVGLVALAVLGVWIWVRTMLVGPALMLEGGRFWASVARAWRLTRGTFWRVFGIMALVLVIVGVITQVLAWPVSALVGVLSLTGQTFWVALVTAVLTAVTSTITTTYQAAVTALLYIDVRMRREGLDLELAAAAGAG